MTEDLSLSIQLVPLALFAILVFFKAICSKPLIETVGSLFEFDGLVYILFVSVLTIAPSLASPIDTSFEAALVISVCLILARLYMAVVPVQEVFEAFFWSGILSIAILVLVGFGAFMQSLQTLARFTLFSFHPNLLAFLLAGYFCAMVWKFLVGNWQMKVLTGMVGFIDLVVIFFASSRGSIVGILAGVVFIVGLAMAAAEKKTRKRIIRSVSLAVGLLLCLVLFFQSRAWVQDSFTFVDKVLQLTQDQRGVDSGFSGRFDKWTMTLRMLSDGSWLFGHGIRSSDAMEDNLIDNSYLVMLYEAGLLTLLLVTWRYLIVLRSIVHDFFRCRDRINRICYLCLALMLITFLVNNIVARFLLSVGNPYSLLAVLLFATPTRLLDVPIKARHADSRAIHMAGPPIQTIS